MGLVSTLTIIALGLVVTALTGITLTGTGIQAAIWTALAALVGAYAAGLTAVRAASRGTHNHDGIAAMTHGDATMTGLVTGGVLVLLSTLYAVNTAGRLIGAATNVAGNVASTAANAASSAADAAPSGASIASFVNGIDQQDVAQLIADGNADLGQEQVQAAANVVTGIFRRAQYDLGQQDLGNITDFASARVNAIKEALSGEQFVTRLQRQGLTAPQATEVQTEITQQVDRLQKQAEQVAQSAEDKARVAARNAGLAWLLGSGLTLLLAVMGARSASTHRAIPTVPLDRS